MIGGRGFRVAVAVAVGVAVGVVTGCGLGLIEDPGGGDSHLPTQGAGPYSKLVVDRETPADEPYVVAVFPMFLRDPSVVTRDDGGYRLWFSYQDDPAGAVSEIWTAELPALLELPDVGPDRALASDQPWEQGAVAAPCVVRVSETDLVMFYQGGVSEPAVGLAESRDNGRTWTKHPSNPIVTDLVAPTAARLPDGEWLLYASRPDRSGILGLRSRDAVTWGDPTGPVIAPRPGVADAFDRDGVTDPWLVVRPTVTGHLHHALFYTGVLEPDPDEEPDLSIGWAGSFDGLSFQRFASPEGPILDPGGTSEHGASVLLGPTRGVMFFSESHRGVQSIAAAVHP